MLDLGVEELFQAVAQLLLGADLLDGSARPGDVEGVDADVAGSEVVDQRAGLGCSRRRKAGAVEVDLGHGVAGGRHQLLEERPHRSVDVALEQQVRPGVLDDDEAGVVEAVEVGEAQVRVVVDVVTDVIEEVAQTLDLALGDVGDDGEARLLGHGATRAGDELTGRGSNSTTSRSGKGPA